MNTMTRVNIPNILVDGYMWSDMLTNLTREKFPHMDMVKLNDNQFRVDVSLAGYNKKDISITLDSNILKISGAWKNVDENGYEVKGINYLMHGIAKRAFHRELPLAEYIEVGEVKMDNGVLSIELNKEMPDELKPKEFKIA